MTAKEMFANSGFVYCIEREGCVDYYESNPEYICLGDRSISILGDGTVYAEQITIHEDNSPFELSKDLIIAIATQLREFGIAV